MMCCEKFSLLFAMNRKFLYEIFSELLTRNYRTKPTALHVEYRKIFCQEVMKMLIHESCENFASLLAEKSPVPGGGGASAFVGALSAALCSMAGNFTVGKKKYADVEQDIRANLAKSDELRRRLLSLVDDDAEAFTPLSEAYRLPKDDPERPAKLESATLNACTVPLEIIRCCAEITGLLGEMLEKGSTMLISDVGCGAVLCRASMESAAMNIYINTSTLHDREQAGNIERETDELLTKYTPELSEIAQKVIDIIRK